VPLKGKRILIPRARVARDVLPEALRQRGARVEVVEAYRTILPPESVERARRIFEHHPPTLAIFTSSSTVQNLFQLLPEQELRQYLSRIKIASIGPVTSRTLRERGLAVNIEPGQYTVPALVTAIQSALEKPHA
jgi:uroporphyrinogen III methyltransferase/synthase